MPMTHPIHRRPGAARRRARTTLAVAAAAIAVLPAAAAQADVASFDGSTIHVQGGDGNETITLSIARPGVVAVTADQAGPGCERNDVAGQVECPLGPGGVAVAMAGGDDRVTSLGLTEGTLPDRALTVDLGAGNDTFKGDVAGETVTAGPGDDTLEGGAGDDVFDGGDGNDTLTGDGGRDQLRGAGGDDTLDGDRFETPAADLIDGGPGDDRAAGWTQPSGSGPHPPATVTLNGAADDGRAGEGDDVRDIERITSNVSGTFVLSDAPDVVEVWANLDHGASTVSTLGGADAVTGGNATERIDGGAGDDRLEGGFGDDAITGGPGRDQVVGDMSGSQCGLFQSCTMPHGNDVIDVRDGEADSVTCGVGEDRVTADPQDTVGPDCEQVDRAGAGPGPKPGTTGRGATLKATLSPASLRRALAKGLVVRLTAPGAGRISAEATRAGRRVARGARTVRRAGATRVVLRFDRRARRALRRARTARLKVAVRFTPRSGKAVRQALTVTLRRR